VRVNLDALRQAKATDGGEPVSETACMRRLQRASAGPQGPGLLHSGGNLSKFMFSLPHVSCCVWLQEGDSASPEEALGSR